MRTCTLKKLVGAGVIAAWVPLVCAAPASAGDVQIPYRDGDWHFKQVAHGRDPGFETRDSQGWPTGRAGFGTTDHVCSWNSTRRVKTAWTPDTDMLLTHLFYLPEATTNSYASKLLLKGTVDNSVDIYVNGEFVTHVEGGGCEGNNISVDLAPYQQPEFNELEMRASDNGGASYIDVKLTDKIAYYQ